MLQQEASSLINFVLFTEIICMKIFLMCEAKIEVTFVFSCENSPKHCGNSFIIELESFVIVFVPSWHSMAWNGNEVKFSLWEMWFYVV